MVEEEEEEKEEQDQEEEEGEEEEEELLENCRVGRMFSDLEDKTMEPGTFQPPLIHSCNQISTLFR